MEWLHILWGAHDSWVPQPGTPLAQKLHLRPFVKGIRAVLALTLLLSIFSTPSVSAVVNPELLALFRAEPVSAFDSQAKWGGEPTFTSERIWAEYLRHQSLSDFEVMRKDIEPYVARKAFRDEIRRRCPNCFSHKSGNYNDKFGRSVRKLRVDHLMWIGLSVDQAAIEVHLSHLTISNWLQRRSVMENLVFGAAAASGLHAGTLSGNGHLTRDNQSGFENDLLWFRNSFVDFYNHPALPNRIFDFYPRNALTLDRLGPEARDGVLWWIQSIDLGYTRYLEKLEKALDSNSLDLYALPLIFDFRNKKFHFSTLGGDFHDLALNLDYSDRIQFRGFKNQTTAVQWIDEIVFLENRIQRNRAVDGLIRPSVTKFDEREAVKQFYSYGQGLHDRILRRLLPEEFSALPIPPRAAEVEDLDSTGIRSKESELLARLFEKLLSAVETYSFLSTESEKANLIMKNIRILVEVAPVKSRVSLIRKVLETMRLNPKIRRVRLGAETRWFANDFPEFQRFLDENPLWEGSLQLGRPIPPAKVACQEAIAAVAR